ncbi:ABC transporter substrate-binding protein [Candidatus Latescibacterota bacterium]
MASPAPDQHGAMLLFYIPALCVNPAARGATGFRNPRRGDGPSAMGLLPIPGPGRTRTACRSILLLAATGGLLLAGCGGMQDSDVGAGSGLKPVPRNRTLILDCAETSTCAGQIIDYNSFNPYVPGGISRIGYNFLYEPLYFYLAYRETGNIVPWIATGHEYNDDYTEVTIHLRDGVEWSDGTPWTAHDLVFTIEMLRANAPEMTFSTDMETWVAEAVAVDDLTARISLRAPNPRFVFTYFTHNFDNGVPIVPRHVWEGREEPITFLNFDPERGWPVVSGPYRLARSEPEQRIWDLRQDWWAAKIGFQPLPRVERLIYLPYQDEVKRVQNLMGNYLDTSLDLRPPNIETAVLRNPAITTWSGREKPFGRRDWWPISLGFNHLEEPFGDPRIRWAINHAIDRDQLVEVAWHGAGEPTLHPFPEFPPLMRYLNQIDDLLEKYPVGLFDPARTAAIMEEIGWQRDPEGYWSRDGQRLKIVIDIYDFHQDIAAVLTAQLARAGFLANFRKTPDAGTRMMQGDARAFITGHGGSVRDPYFTLRLYHSRFVQPTGTATQYFWRWANEDFDRLVDRMGATSPDDPELAIMFRQAMEIWLRELPSVPLLQWYHRIPYNQTYWTNWPSEDNPYANPSYWARTWLLVLLGLQPTQ